MLGQEAKSAKFGFLNLRGEFFDKVAESRECPWDGWRRPRHQQGRGDQEYLDIKTQ